MLRVLRHYLPLRKALLIAGETVLLTLVLSLWLTAHLWDATSALRAQLAQQVPALSIEDAALRCILTAFSLSVLAQLAIAFNELYDVRVSGSNYDRSSRFVESAGSALGIGLGSVLLAHVWGLQRVLDVPPLSLSQRVQTVVFGLLTGFALLYWWRAAFHWMLRRSNFGERVLIFGSGKGAFDLAREIRERPDAGYELVGLLPDAGIGAPREPSAQERRGGQLFSLRRADVAGGPALALAKDPGATVASAPQTAAAANVAPAAPAEPWLADLLLPSLPSAEATSLFDLAQKRKVDVVVIALEDRRKMLPVDDLLDCRLAGISVREREALYEQITGKIAVESLRPSYLIFNEGFARHPFTELGKRAVDVVVALAMLLVTWPLMLATAIAVRLDSPGPILFSQERVGLDNKPFTLFKFRSMRADAEKHSGPVWATQDDPRITRCGKFIRKTRLDELPQLFNVLAGHMSLVGPRPERPHFVQDLSEKIPYFRQRHIVKPGLTGWAQINYRYGSTFEDAVQKLQYDLFYIKNQSLLFDLSILFNTVKIVILRKGT
ncbi:MAG: TIGR03013 family PEP-CTERM/XrtA system glycosyltransferase [Planctomycetes bacterium]|nr:TIGR03013 family PEP-CTERM/XrtA system glycosyltransferase [Planctomycetota bacterium]